MFTRTWNIQFIFQYCSRNIIVDLVYLLLLSHLPPTILNHHPPIKGQRIASIIAVSSPNWSEANPSISWWRTFALTASTVSLATTDRCRYVAEILSCSWQTLYPNHNDMRTRSKFVVGTLWWLTTGGVWSVCVCCSTLYISLTNRGQQIHTVYTGLVMV